MSFYSHRHEARHEKSEISGTIIDSYNQSVNIEIKSKWQNFITASVISHYKVPNESSIINQNHKPEWQKRGVALH